MDIEEGADAVIVKPGVFCLDIIRRAADRFTVPIFAYQVSGEYAMLKIAASHGFLPEKAGVMESLLSFKRAGARAILTYYACDVARWLKAE